MNLQWTTEQLQFLKDNAGTMNDKTLSASLTAKFGRLFTMGATRKMRQRLGLKKEGHRGFSKMVEPIDPDAVIPS